MKKVVIGISGGVDSSVAAILLKQQGYEVIGITFIFTDDFDTSDAINVCKNLNIKHHIVDYRKEFKQVVIDSFINDYKNGKENAFKYLMGMVMKKTKSSANPKTVNELLTSILSKNVNWLL